MSVHPISAWRAARRLSGVRLVTCPENGKVAAVRFSRRAVVEALQGHQANPRLAACSRWCVRGPCEQLCVPQATPPDSAVTSIVARWLAGRRCVLCDKPLSDASCAGHHIGLRSPDGDTVEWSDVAPEALPEALRVRQPVCWDCHVGETFRRLFPEFVVDR
jgi:hypothetical protein